VTAWRAEPQETGRNANLSGWKEGVLGAGWSPEPGWLLVRSRGGGAKQSGVGSHRIWTVWIADLFGESWRRHSFGLGVVFGSLWKVRNKMAVEKKLINSPDVIVYNIISLMQQWMMLLWDKEQGLVMMAAKMIRKKIYQVVAKKGK
jgi:hypothetical protein